MDQRGIRLYQREQAEFVLHVLHRPERALQLAKENWTVQRSPQDMRIHLAAGLAAGRPQSAEPVLRVLAHSHLQDPGIARLRAQSAGTVRRSDEVAARGRPSP
jgi:hypothetical protein